MVYLSPKKSTKFVALTFFMRSGHRIVGEFHVPLNTSSATRPSDVLNECGAFISLANATVTNREGYEHQAAFMQVARDAILWVEFPPLEDSWQKGREAQEHGHKAK